MENPNFEWKRMDKVSLRRKRKVKNKKVEEIPLKLPRGLPKSQKNS